MRPSCVRFTTDGVKLHPWLVSVRPAGGHTVRSAVRIPSEHGNAARPCRRTTVVEKYITKLCDVCSCRATHTMMQYAVSVHNTAQNSSDNLSSYLQTTIIAQMLSIGEKESCSMTFVNRSKITKSVILS